ncbi:MAG: (d)CMP kinase [Desulfocapsa sp.]|nr:MAG: (d)CMP kinase [Desulfocapsa sp.]
MKNTARKIVTIDGPSGVGKSTISKRVAASLSFTYLDTGAMYRSVGYKLQESNVDLEDGSAVQQCLDGISLRLLPAASKNSEVRVILDDEDISHAIRSSEMSMLASKVSAIPAVRKTLTRMQREIGGKGHIVAEGRDTGTVVFPAALWKFYLDAAPEERMRRRAAQLREVGKEVDEKELLEMIIKRDRNDQNRSIAPLCKAEDAISIDTSSLSIDEVVQEMLAKITT